MTTFTLRTEVPVTPEAFWQHMSIAAVNRELRPWVRMTAPRHWRHCPLEQWTTGTVLFRSVILLFGFLPIDVHAVQVDFIDPAGGFRERSSSWMNTSWEHDRSTTATETGCIVEDRVTVVGRVPGLARLLGPVYRFVFRHRHRRLRAIHGAAAP